MNNPWLNMHYTSQRRVDANNKYDFFWIVGDRGNYGLYLRLNIAIDIIDLIDNIKGISIYRGAAGENMSGIFIVLNNNEDWELFIVLCKDLINIAESCKNEHLLLNKLNNRLHRWQRLLSKNHLHNMTESRQMGLLSELLFLKEYMIPKLGCRAALIAWVGIDFDKQDFILEEYFIEIKSYISTKKPVIKISSLQQLATNSLPIYLGVYGLIKLKDGISILSLIEELYISFIESHPICEELFELKLAGFGYIKGITNGPFFEYKVDSFTLYTVSDDFPKIVPAQIHNSIIDVEYYIDLHKCAQFKVNSLPNW